MVDVEAEQESEAVHDAGMDSARAWIQVFAAFLMNFAGSGTLNSFGVYQDYYLTQPFAGGKASAAQIALIGSLAFGIRSFVGVFAGPLSAKIGFRISITIGALLTAAGYILSSLCTDEINLLYLTQGVMVGLGGSLTFFPASCVPSQWFAKRRGIANGVAVAGSGLGGFLISNLSQWLLTSQGLTRVLKIQGGIVAAILLCSVALLKTRVPLQTVNNMPAVAAGGAAAPPALQSAAANGKERGFDLKVMKNAKYIAFVMSVALSNFGYYVPFTYVTVDAHLLHLSPKKGAFALSMISASGAIGRVLLGFMSDSLGDLETITICTLLAGLSAIVVWPFATAFGWLLLFSILFGLFAGGFQSLVPVVLSTQFGVKELPLTTGVTNTISAFGIMFGTPLAGALMQGFSNARITKRDTRRWLLPGMLYGGITMLLAGITTLVMSLAIRARHQQQPLPAVRAHRQQQLI